MKKMIAMTLILLSFSLAGCVKMHMDTVIEKDGSGTFTMTYAMSPDVAQAFKELSATSMPGQEKQNAPTLDDFSKEKLEDTCKKHDVKLTKFERGTVEGKDQVTFEMKFKSLQDLSAVLSSTQGENSGLGIFKMADGNYILREYDLPAEEMAEEAEEPEEPDTEAMQNMDPQAMQKSMEIMGKLMASASQLDVAMRITVPGEVVSNNAMRQEGNTLIWEINSSNMMTAGGGMEPEIVFSGKGLKISAPAWEE
jgi:hypothetical protein